MDSIYETPKLVSLISKGCEVIRVPKSQFLALADDETLAKLHDAVRQFPGDSDLCRIFLRRNQWDCFKHELLDAMVSDIQKGKAFENNLRNFRRMEYLKIGVS